MTEGIAFHNFFWLFSFWFFVLVCVLVAELLWVAAGEYVEFGISMFVGGFEYGVIC